MKLYWIDPKPLSMVVSNLLHLLHSNIEEIVHITESVDLTDFVNEHPDTLVYVDKLHEALRAVRGEEIRRASARLRTITCGGNYRYQDLTVHVEEWSPSGSFPVVDLHIH